MSLELFLLTVFYDFLPHFMPAFDDLFAFYFFNFSLLHIVFFSFFLIVLVFSFSFQYHLVLPSLSSISFFLLPVILVLSIHPFCLRSLASSFRSHLLSLASFFLFFQMFLSVALYKNNYSIFSFYSVLLYM